MPLQKRKRPHDELTDSAAAQPAKSQPQEPTRRVTRQNPQGLANEEKHHLRSGRVRANLLDKSAETNPVPERARGKRDDAPKLVATAPEGVPVKQTRNTRRSRISEEAFKENIQPSGQGSIRNTARPSPEHAQLGRKDPPQAATAPRPSFSQSQAQSPSLPAKPTRKQPKQPRSPIPSSSAAAVATATALATPRRTLGEKPLKPPPTPRSDRNIDKIVLGNICFKAWYPSYYGKEVLGEVAGNAGGGKDISARMGGGKRDPPMLDRLYICPCCFKYSKELVSWWEHVRCCESKGAVPGKKVYTHPKGLGARKVKSTATDAPPGTKAKGKRKVASAEATANNVDFDEEGEWSIWEVDGENERLFCQNLSLFAKLFLDNKSVFFDVSGFNYFLLVYTPPPLQDSSGKPSSQFGLPPSALQEVTIEAPTPPPNHDQHPGQLPLPPLPSPSPRRPHIVGFFSKEKMSWDNNNLACILVFPPWQRKGLGSLLMGVSYEISRREGVLGGPEKPISELGRKGYKRFWAGEVARWLLSVEAPTPQQQQPASPSPRSPASLVAGDDEEEDQHDGAEEAMEEEISEMVVKDKILAEAGDDDEEESATPLVVDIQMCSQATWIVPEDCLLVLREMGVVEEVEPGATAAAAAIAAAARDGSLDEDTAAVVMEEKHAEPLLAKEATTAAKPVPRVRVDRAAVRRWVAANKIDLERTCDPDGFVEGYAIKKAASDAEESE